MPVDRPRVHLALQLSAAWVILPGLGCDTTTLIDATLVDPVPAIAASTSLLDFGDVVVGDEKTQVVTLQSVGQAPLTIHAIRIDPARGFELVAPDLEQGLRVEGTAALTVRFAPTQEGLALAVLLVESDAVYTPRLQITLHGSGTPVGPRPAALVGATRTFGFSYGDAATLPGSRLLVMDKEGAWSDKWYRLTLVRVDGERTRVLDAGALVEGFNARGLVAAGPAQAVGLLSTGSWPQPEEQVLQVYSIDDDNRVQVRGRLTLPAPPTAFRNELAAKGAANASALVVCLESGIASVDLRDADSPALRATLPGSCVGVVVDRVGELVYIGTGQGVDRYTVAQDASLTRVDAVLSGVPGRLLGDSSRGLVYHSAGGLLLIDRATLQISSIQGYVSGALTTVGDQVLGWSWESGRLQLWDIYSSGQSSLVAEAVDLHNQEPIAADTSVIVLAGSELNTGLVLLDPGALHGGQMALLRHPAQGVVGRLVAHGGEIFALDRTAVRRVSLSDPANPALLAGGPFRQQVDVVRLGSGAATSTHVVGWNPGDPLSGRLLDGLTRWNEAGDASDYPDEIGWSADFGNVVWFTSGDGRNLVLGSQQSDSLTLRTLNLASSGDQLVDPWMPGATLQVAAESGWSCTSATYESGSLTQDFDQRRAVLAINRVDCPRQGLLALFDLSDRVAPRLIGQRAAAQSILSARVAQDRVLLTDTSAAAALDIELGDGLRLLAPDGAGGMVELVSMTWPAQTLGHLLHFDGERAYVAEQDGLLALDVSDSALAIRFRVATPEPPISALLIDDHIVLSGLSGVYVVRLPVD